MSCKEEEKKKLEKEALTCGSRLGHTIWGFLQTKNIASCMTDRVFLAMVNALLIDFYAECQKKMGVSEEQLPEEALEFLSREEYGDAFIRLQKIVSTFYLKSICADSDRVEAKAGREVIDRVTDFFEDPAKMMAAETVDVYWIDCSGEFQEQKAYIKKWIDAHPHATFSEWDLAFPRCMAGCSGESLRKAICVVAGASQLSDDDLASILDMQKNALGVIFWTKGFDPRFSPEALSKCPPAMAANYPGRLLVDIGALLAFGGAKIS